MLLYFLANSDDQFVNCNLNFNGEFSFHYDEKTKSLNIKRNENYLPNYWGEHVEWVTAIAGQNGVGKTTVLDFIRTRFFAGFRNKQDAILVYKIDGNIEIWYDTSLFQESNKIQINGQLYETEYSLFMKNKGIDEITLYEIRLKIKLFPIDAHIKNEISKGKVSGKYAFEKDSRISKEIGLIYYTNQWNYFNVDRELERRMKEEFSDIDYSNLAIANKIDMAIYEGRKIRTPIFISTMTGYYYEVQNVRFEIDYLYKVQELDMLRTLNFLQNSVDFELIDSVIKVPEEIIISYDFSEDISRNLISLPSENDYLRFEDREKNFKLENMIYDFLFTIKTDEILKVDATMYLVFIERLFFDIYVLFFHANFIMNKLLEVHNKENYLLKTFQDIKVNLSTFKDRIRETIMDIPCSETYFEHDRDMFVESFERIFDSYINMLNFFETDFFENIDTQYVNTVMYLEIRNARKTAPIFIELPIIKISQKDNKSAYEFLENYSKLESRNKPLIFQWHNLSSGETQLLNLFTGLSEAIKNFEKDQILILLDEVEISLHPMLQKQFMRMLMEILNKTAERYNKKIQVILTTHSPFVLSELPLHSLILLEKDHEQKVQVKNELENLTTTLGANIHELFSHSFFLTGGLIGEYAKERINEVANNLLGIESNLNKEDIRKFINQVGEPIIKSRLVELFEQKYALTKGEEMEKLQKQMAELQERMKQLEDGEGK